MNFRFEEDDPNKESEQNKENKENNEHIDQESQDTFGFGEQPPADAGEDDDVNAIPQQIVEQEPVEVVEEDEVANELPQKKAPWSRRKKIIVSVLCVLLALLLIVGSVGTALFFHYYNKLDVQGRDEVNAEERVIKLYDAETDMRYTITISLDGLSDDETELLDNWYISKKELVISIPKDPATMTEGEHAAFVKQILAELLRLKNGEEQKVLIIKLYNTAFDREYDLEIDGKFISEGDDYVLIMEYVATKADQRLTFTFAHEDPDALTDEQKAELYVAIAAAIRDGQRARLVFALQDRSTGKVVEFSIYLDEITEEQGRMLATVKQPLVMPQLPADIGALTAEQRAEFLAQVLAYAEDSLITRYTIALRDTATGTVYDFAVKKTEIADAQLTILLKQIDRGALDMELDINPNVLEGEERRAFIVSIFEAIDLLEHPPLPKEYQLSLSDRKTGTAYTLIFTEDRVSDAQLVELLTAINQGKTVILSVAKDPAAMTEDEFDALIEAVLDAIAHPLRALPLTDTKSQTKYTFYFYDEDVTLEQLSYLKQQIESGKAISVSVEKNPDDMQADERNLLLKNIIAAIKGEQIVEYSITVRDKESGKAYVLKFTKLEVDDATVFGYLLEQTQRGGVLDVSGVWDDPAKMSLADRKTLFASAAEAVKAKITEENNQALYDQMMEHLNNIAKNPPQHTEDIYNVLLVGTDERKEGGDVQNSDTMILVTLNYKDKTITMTSLMRDTCVEVKYTSGGKERVINTRLNAAYALGGIKVLISTIESNFGVKIDNYVKVNWFSFMDVFEVLGDIKVNVKDNNQGKDDLETLNKVLMDNCKLFGYDYASNKLTQYGEQYLNPVQLLAFVRYRTGDADFGRTARQREALAAVFDKFKSSSLLKINEILNTVLPLITTDLSEGNCASLLLKFPSIIGYKMQQHRFPQYKEFSSDSGGKLWPDWPKALSNMYKKAYGSLCPEQYK